MATNPNETQKVVDNTGKTVAYIDPRYIDNLNFSLNLFGDNLSELSRALNENFIRVAQGFYSDKPPINPIVGQSWLNKTDNITYKWMGENWVQTTLDTTYDSFMFVKYDVTDIKEFVLDEFVFNFTIKNIKLYNQDLNDVKFVIDPFDSRKIILKESNVTTLYIMVFHPNDTITNPFINRKIEIFTESGQTQFDIDSFLDGTNINSLSVSLNDTMLRNNEFFVQNNVLNIDGKIYRVRKDDRLSVWLHGGSLSSYYTNFKVHTSRRESFLKIPKFFKNIVSIEIIDVDDNVTINPIETIEYDDYFFFEFLDKKNVIANIYARII
jgi:hypothetical protein